MTSSSPITAGRCLKGQHTFSENTFVGMSHGAYNRLFSPQYFINSPVMLLSKQMLAFCFVLGIAHSGGNNPMSSPAAGEVIGTENPYQIEWFSDTPGALSTAKVIGQPFLSS
jgi:hypothetical protein